MPLASAERIEAVTGLDASKVARAESRALAAERKARRELGGARYDEVASRVAGDPDFEALVEAESLWCLYLALPFLNLTPNETGGLVRSTGWDESRSEKLSERETQSYRERIREQAEAAFEEAKEEGPAADEEEPEDDDPAYHI